MADPHYADTLAVLDLPVFNSLLHGVDVTSILRTSMPISQMIFGVITTFILAWFAGAMTAVFYNLWVGEKYSRSTD